MKVKNHKSGIGMIECLIALVAIMILMGAIMTFRYFTVVSIERAENQLMAARSAYFLSEAWRGQKGDLAFDPTQQDFDADFRVEVITSSSLLGTYPSGSYSDKLQNQAGINLLGSYRLYVDDKEFQTQLFHSDTAGVQDLRSIYILVVWQDHQGVRYEYYLPTLTETL